MWFSLMWIFQLLQLCFMNSENIESFEAPLALFVSHIALWLLFFL